MGSVQMEETKKEPELITSIQLAAMLSMSVKFVEKHRNRIAGGIKIGNSWRFRVAEIRARLATGRDILIRK